MSNVFYDTNALLTLQDTIFNSEDQIWISLASLYELENIKESSKKDNDIKQNAKHIVKLLDENKNRYTVTGLSSSISMNVNLDNIIINDALRVQQTINDLIFVTDDLCCKNIAYAKGLNVRNAFKPEKIYQGYKIIQGDTESINNQMSNIDYSNWNINEYLIINNIDDGSFKEMRYDGESFVGLKLPPQKIVKAKNSLQRCVLDMLLDPNITICAILGTYGSGKTFLAMKMALYQVKEKGFQSKVLGVREPRGEGKEVGFLPGELSSKTEHFFAPLAQQLNGGEFELESLKSQGVLEEIIPYYMKGTTYNDTIILVDEAEDLTEKQIRLIGTRLGNNSRIFLSGDYKQSLIDSSKNNALVKMCNSFKGSKNFGCITLDTDVRSEASKMFADLYSI